MEDMIKNVVSRVVKKTCPAVAQKSRSNDSRAVEKSCVHNTLEQYVSPCLKCEVFCNCGHSYFPREYPDVLVRSLDKQILKLSGNLVRASSTLRGMVNRFTKAGGEPEGTLEEVSNGEDAERNDDVSSSSSSSAVVSDDDTIIEEDHYQELKERFDSAPVVLPPRQCIRIKDTARKFREYRREQEIVTCKWEELVDLRKEKVLVLYDQQSETPTLGITREILEKVDYYVNMHLDDVDMRVEKKKRRAQFRASTSLYRDRTPAELQEELDNREDNNTFQYEDWEEEFFNVGTFRFFQLHQANQELLIWDLYYALEKWVFLGRGYPRHMVNGIYDLFTDPDFDKWDKGNVYALPGVRYPNPFRPSWHMKERLNISNFHRVHFTPRWWSTSREEGNRKNIVGISVITASPGNSP